MRKVLNAVFRRYTTTIIVTKRSFAHISRNSPIARKSPCPVERDGRGGPRDESHSTVASKDSFEILLLLYKLLVQTVLQAENITLVNDGWSCSLWSIETGNMSE